MQESTTCYSKLEKPGKDEKSNYLQQAYRSVRICPDCDTKRTTQCKDPNCARN
jgi:hypothetical protein